MGAPRSNARWREGCFAASPSALLTALLLGAPASAQPAASNSATALPEVVVTAERRESTVQDTPLAIAVVSGDALQQRGLSSGKDIADLVPGLKLFHERGGTSVYIRGIGNSASNPYADPNVSYNVDGVALTLPSGANSQFYDVARVEVLKGPQGTLYGRNATAGAVNVISNNPTFEPGGRLRLSVGDYDMAEFEGAANLPLSDTLSTRIAMHALRHDGYLSNGLKDADDVALRTKLLWRPNDGVSLLLGADYSVENGKGDQRVPVNASTGQYYWNVVTGSDDPWQMRDVFPSPVGGQTRIVPADPRVENRNWGVWAELNLDVGIGRLTVLPAYRSYHQNWRDSDQGFGFQQIIRDKSKSIEARLASNDAPEARLQWVAGLFYLDESLPNWVRVQQSYETIGSTTPGLFQVTDTPSSTTRSYAVFGQASYSLTPELRITGGVRYTKDRKRENGSTTNDVLPGVPYTYAVRWAVDNEKTTWRIGADWNLTNEVMLYANARTGYKAGGFGAGPTPGGTPGLSIDPALVPLLTYKPEELTAYDFGVKSSWLDKRLFFSGEVFYWEYKDQQVQTIFLLPLVNLPPVIVPAVVNAGRGTAQGLDLEVQYQITAQDRVSVSLAYLDTEYSSFRYPFIFADNPVDNSGKPFVSAPRYSAAIDYSHAWKLASGASVTARIGSRLSTRYWTGYDYTPRAQEQDAYSRTDVSLEYEAENGAWFIRGWVKNVENVDVRVSSGLAVPGSGAAPAPVGTDGRSLYWVSLQPPRTMGVTVGANF